MTEARTDTYEEVSTKLEAWAGPIADQILAEAAVHRLQTPPDCPASDLLEMTTTLVGGIAAAFIGESLLKMLPRASQEAGIGTIRFKRDARNEVCVTVDGLTSPFGRMSVREAYVSTFHDHGYADALCIFAAERIEEAFLTGRAYLISFLYDPAQSTPDESVYVWTASSEELQGIRQQWQTHDDLRAGFESMRRKRGRRIESQLKKAGSRLPDFVKDDLTTADLVRALDLLGASLSLLMQIDEEPWIREVLLRKDGSVLLDPETGEEMKAPWLLERLTDHFKDTPPYDALLLDPVALLAWCHDEGWKASDLFDDLTCNKVIPDGLRMYFKE